MLRKIGSDDDDIPRFQLHILVALSELQYGAHVEMRQLTTPNKIHRRAAQVAISTRCEDGSGRRQTARLWNLCRTRAVSNDNHALRRLGSRAR
jgi:hypothetical protein